MLIRPKLLVVLVNLLEGVDSETHEEEVNFFESDEQTEITAFTQLSFARRSDVDPFKEVQDPKLYFVSKLQQLSQSRPGQIQQLIPPQLTEVLLRYSQQTNVQQLLY